MKDLHAVRGAQRLRQMIAEGEHETQDFKFSISDARKIARSLSAFANCRGGRLLIGVKDNGVIAGVRNEEDIFVVEQAAQRYCRPEQHVDFQAYKTEDGTRVIVASIEASHTRPVTVAESDGKLKAYYRVADENIAAHPLMVRAWQSAAAGRNTGLGAIHAQALGTIARLGHIDDARQLALEMHIGLKNAEQILDTLADADLLDFFFDGTAFRIGRKE